MEIKKTISGMILFWPVKRETIISKDQEFDIHSCTMGVLDRTTPSSGLVKSLVLREAGLFQRTSLFDALTGGCTFTEEPADLPDPRSLSLPGIRLTKSWKFEGEPVDDK